MFIIIFFLLDVIIYVDYIDIILKIVSFKCLFICIKIINRSNWINKHQNDI